THLRERELVGWDHAVLGAHVIEHWQLPREISQVVAWHHQPGRAFVQGGSIAQSVAILRLADRIDYQIGVQRELDEQFVNSLERESVFEYTDYDAAMLRAAWPRLVAAVDEGRSVFSAKKK
ncbi:MAG TPA: HDOD domain-containing protein, partial [Polyangiaceae bacterium]